MPKDVTFKKDQIPIHIYYPVYPNDSGVLVPNYKRPYSSKSECYKNHPFAAGVIEFREECTYFQDYAVRH